MGRRETRIADTCLNLIPGRCLKSKRKSPADVRVGSGGRAQGGQPLGDGDGVGETGGPRGALARQGEGCAVIRARPYVGQAECHVHCFVKVDDLQRRLDARRA